MSNIFSYEFEELPLVIHNGIDAALINGMAEIKYDRSGHWEVDSVSVEGYQPLTPEQRAAGKKSWIYVPATPDIEITVTCRLEQEWFGKVQDAINEHLADAREAARENALEARYEARRDDRAGA